MSAPFFFFAEYRSVRAIFFDVAATFTTSQKSNKNLVFAPSEVYTQY